eukprot:CAMPEP_0176370190 /NCGR_PEP_ID=MMETSP0126-20121128/23808_1 /TAXON_ID=141414 ORGANISM="Strombidinopsis acuminatum, Strain SPMC142" /NCGR_SAMPLE_ID=MMETSP0126 /ASSEMBLY_ACC=CAM_ASM_000229 /LENGTH=36 /DNA_ID= /DNA_START= /DNA_END= /DNA_ORIENTATION=
MVNLNDPSSSMKCEHCDSDFVEEIKKKQSHPEIPEG